MIKYFAVVLCLILAGLFSMYFWIGVPKIYSLGEVQKPVPHLWDNASVSIGEIEITAVYFVPKNKTNFMITDWSGKLEVGLKKAAAFYDLQLRGLAKINYKIHPDPIIGFENNLFYDTDVTQHGNPEALRRITLELEDRDFFQPNPNGPYKILAVMYEGVGASGSDRTAFVSRVFLSDVKYGSQGASVLAHEIGHAFGIPDAYLPGTAAPLSQDIMGVGQRGPIEKTYLEKETLKKLGI
ncbi:hypothetical protein A2926_03160 [Candidatus Giovannonibacteria bacterium RIFCSPLOWO2_01_FULL_44_40]|uniref:Uncharacterized protein n=1 Tax=Candidatus Giovannonibacteria bacterium RIFCSPHIGHO2_01_FULL_45_23 TaxID=1798325 RepID=A0A1F5VFL5_9BACT|nr:MAG: hypothetical protein A2834_00720 [Candidatus Giovannonibacteria bacterium RIFCSPHIGHO2_01_FULL_45_23]OGF75767.1 MAG: hypothetical protein A3C77_02545 [Candidatus Giovannonibacteria bacterium RIFCSPHIGHO2_02_FULL_45_13]OGF79856.1 MAG: hypothetical protein A2926_03160 [Candidatus Giovannonibacteria bacterium RIFCSPLOWO2_01_FULL_44_40]